MENIFYSEKQIIEMFKSGVIGHDEIFSHIICNVVTWTITVTYNRLTKYEIRQDRIVKGIELTESESDSKLYSLIKGSIKKVDEKDLSRVTLKIDAFANITREIANLSTSSRLKVGCIILKKDFSKIVAIGYNGSYPKAPVYEHTGTEEESLESGQSGFIHAEINAITKFNGHSPLDYLVLVTHSPCSHCTKVLVNAGFRDIFWMEQYRDTEHLDFILNRVGATYGNLDKLKEIYYEL